MLQPMLFQDNNPPILLQPPELTPVSHLINAVVVGLANDLSNNASVHPGRIFAFNICSSNGYNNAAFIDAVNVTLNVLEFMYLSSGGVPESYIRQAVEFGARYVVANNVVNVPPLANCVDQSVLSGCRNVMNDCVNMLTQLNNLRQRAMQQQVPQQGYVQQGMFHQQGMFQQPAVNNFFSNQQQQVRGVQAQVNSGPPRSERYSTYVQASEAKVSQGTAVPMTTAQSGLVMDPTILKSSRETVTQVLTVRNWVPSIDQPYLEWFDPSTEKECFKRITNAVGNTYVCQYIEPLTEKEMNEISHHLPKLSFGASRVTAPDPMQSAKVLDSLIEKMNNESTAIVADQNDTSSDIDAGLATNLPSEFAYTSSLDNLVFQARHKMACCNMADPSIVIGSVIRPVTFMKNEHSSSLVDYFRELRNSVNLEDAATFIESMLDGTSTKSSINVHLKTVPADIVGYFSAINSKLTLAVNELISINLSLCGLSIDSFCKDYTELGDYISGKYGDTYLRAFQRGSMNILKRFISKYDGDHDDLLAIMGVDPEQCGKENVVEAMIDSYSVTAIPYFMESLKIDPTNGPILIKSGRQPTLHALIKIIFDQAKNQNEVFTGHYIVFLDGRRLRVHEGLIGQECYLVTR